MKRLFFAFIQLLLITAAASAGPVITYPALSPDGAEIAFMYDGDIWAVSLDNGSTRALTRNVDYDYRPVWSPDGSAMAFTSNRSGNYEIYTMPSQGGKPVRLTFHSNFDSAFDWGADGYIYAGSYRDPAGKRFYRLSPEDGSMEQVADYPVFRGKVDKAGRIIFFTDDTAFWRKSYKGSASSSLILAEQNGALTELSVNDDMETYPVWKDENTVCFLSNASGRTGLYSLNIKSGVRTKLLVFDGMDMDQLTASADGETLAFIADFRLFTYKTSSGTVTEITPALASDFQTDPQKSYKIGIREFEEGEVSPDGKKLLFVDAGDLILKDLEENTPEGAQSEFNLTDSEYWEHDAVWSKSSAEVAYVTTEDGNFNIRIMDINSRETTAVTTGASLKSGLSYSPSGRYLAYVEDNARLMIYDTKEKRNRTLLEQGLLRHPVWSPDEEMLAFTVTDEDYDSNVFVMSVDGSVYRDVSLHPEYDYSPVWDLKGENLFWLSNRFGSTSVVRLALSGTDGADLKRDDDPRLKDKQKMVFTTSLSITAAAMLPGDKEIALIIDADKSGALYSLDVLTAKKRRLGDEDSPQTIRVDYINNKVYYLTKDSFKSIPAGGGAATAYSAPVYKHEHRQRLFKEILAESWTLLREKFYDPAMHGADWDGMFRKYSAYLADINRKDALYTVIREMLGTLNASHLGIWGRDESPANPAIGTAAWGGVTDSRMKVTRVLRFGPAAGKVRPGDTLLEINGIPVSKTAEADRALADRSGLLTSFRFKKAGNMDILCGTQAEMAADWRKEADQLRKEYVELKTNGRAAYIHLRRMSQADLDQFMEELGRDARGKKGLVLDVRDNGGGRIAEQLLNMLEREPYAYSENRDMGIIKNWPSKYAWTGPVILLINQRSFSNAEIFPAGFKELGLGKVVGVTTAGGVIGTVDRKLVDGSTFRTPFVKWMTKDGRNMENLGIRPDIYVRNTPESEMNGEDTQLDTALKELLLLMTE